MSKTDPATSPLLVLLRSLSDIERKRLAGWAKTSTSYLYQLAAGSRMPSAALAVRIVQASERMHERTGGESIKVSINDLLIPQQRKASV